MVAPLHAASANDGQCFAPIDLTGDGIADLVRADPTANNGAGTVDVVDGASGVRIVQIIGDTGASSVPQFALYRMSMPSTRLRLLLSPPMWRVYTMSTAT
jgi:hypothetical protein